MNDLFSRKQFLITGGVAAIGAVLAPMRALAESKAAATPATSASPMSVTGVPDFPEHDPQIERARTKRFVIAGHFNLAAVKEMLAADPHLINSTIDWGNGDFETALGGASHMGRRDIAEFLLEHNARMDIFAAAMFGDVEVIKAAVAAHPNVVRVPGPHGIPLIVHAQKGGAPALAVLEFLKPLVS